MAEPMQVDNMAALSLSEEGEVQAQGALQTLVKQARRERLAAKANLAAVESLLLDYERYRRKYSGSAETLTKKAQKARQARLAKLEASVKETSLSETS